MPILRQRRQVIRVPATLLDEWCRPSASTSCCEGGDAGAPVTCGTSGRTIPRQLTMSLAAFDDPNVTVPASCRMLSTPAPGSTTLNGVTFSTLDTSGGTLPAQGWSVGSYRLTYGGFDNYSGLALGHWWYLAASTPLPKGHYRNVISGTASSVDDWDIYCPGSLFTGGCGGSPVVLDIPSGQTVIAGSGTPSTGGPWGSFSYVLDKACEWAIPCDADVWITCNVSVPGASYLSLSRSTVLQRRTYNRLLATPFAWDGSTAPCSYGTFGDLPDDFIGLWIQIPPATGVPTNVPYQGFPYSTRLGLYRQAILSVGGDDCETATLTLYTTVIQSESWSWSGRPHPSCPPDTTHEVSGITIQSARAAGVTLADSCNQITDQPGVYYFSLPNDGGAILGFPNLLGFGATIHSP